MPSPDDRTRAFLYDLTIAPLWSECFNQLLTETIRPPESGRILLVECGTGGLAIEFAHRLRDTGTVTASDSDPARLQIIRDKCQVAQLDNLRILDRRQLADDPVAEGYDLVVGDASLLPTEDLLPMLALLRERVGEGGQITAYALLRGSFDEFFSILWEALYECDLAEDLAIPLEALLRTHLTPADIRAQAAAAGLHNVTITTHKETFPFDSGHAFLESPLIAGYWLDRWLSIVPQAYINTVRASLCDIIDRDRGTYPFEVSIKAALLTARAEPLGHAEEDDTELEEDFDVEPTGE
ncbi:MAG: methyltransferase domain-containing protein [Acidobacteriota bacterium]